MNKKTINKWDFGETAILEERYASNSMAHIAKVLGRTTSSVKGKETAIGLTGKREAGTEEARTEEVRALVAALLAFR